MNELEREWIKQQDARLRQAKQAKYEAAKRRARNWRQQEIGVGVQRCPLPTTDEWSDNPMATIRYFWQCLHCRKMVDSLQSNHHCTHCGAPRAGQAA